MAKRSRRPHPKDDIRVEHFDDERSLGNSIIISLRPGYRFDSGADDHVSGVASITEARALLRGITGCDCDDCRKPEEEARAELAKCVQPDGSLYSLGWYLHWRPGSASATLDGDFTAAELRAIADHMDGEPA